MSYLELSAQEVSEAEYRIAEIAAGSTLIGQFRATSSSATAILGSVFYAYPAVAATTIAGNCLMRAMLAAIFPMVMTPFYRALGAGVASSILGGLGLLFVPWPVYLFYRGRNLRMKSKNARKDI